MVLIIEVDLVGKRSLWKYERRWGRVVVGKVRTCLLSGVCLVVIEFVVVIGSVNEGLWRGCSTSSGKR